jgi:hypothetical protein
MKEAENPRFFEGILPYGEGGQGGCVATLHRLCGDPSRRDVFVTDGTDPSPQEIREQHPDILVATPDTLEILGRERLA